MIDTARVRKIVSGEVDEMVSDRLVLAMAAEIDQLRDKMDEIEIVTRRTARKYGLL